MDLIEKDINKIPTIEKINLVKTIYNEIAEDYVNTFFEDYIDNRFVDKFLNDVSGMKLLDAGCGVGRECKHAQEKGFEIVGVDFSEELIKEAQKIYPQGHYKVMDITQLDFPEEYFDGIIFINTLIHIHKSQSNIVFSKLSKVLKKDGKMLIILQEDDEEKFVEEPLKKGSYTYIQGYSFKDMEKLLNKYDLKIYDYEREFVNDEYCPLNKKLILYVTK